MDCMMLLNCAEQKIFWTVVEPVFIDVMNMHATWNWVTEGALNDFLVLKMIYPIAAMNPVTVTSNAPYTFFVASQMQWIAMFPPPLVVLATVAWIRF